ncbi:MFS transporter [Myceligenerans indicum]|uniref:MFS transporter n=1 Tax=Myceligenerans indicum TaxID=2593663 RepID=A0ABS1LLQ0_9MICO|nr:MFS transporter [Myceligenerans indicum]MBL0887159.1 MFS transporter [Myceligenerans indicum]
MLAPAELRRVRIANTGLFVLTGLAIALWVVNIPAVQARTGISNSTLGLLLLALGAGSIAGMQAAGWISDRWGSRRTAGLSVAVIAVAINGPGLATTAWHLAVILPLLGVGTGAVTVAANDQAVKIQNAYGRPIMSAFHGYFSIAGAAGAGLGALFHTLDMPTTGALGTASLSAAAVGALSVPRLLAREDLTEPAPPVPDGVPEADITTSREGHTAHAGEPSVLAPAIALAVLAVLLNLAEGTATDWSAVHAVEHLHRSQSFAALAYGTFALAMTIGRLTADRFVARLGPVAVVRGGSLLAGAGILGVILSPDYPLTLACWLLFGLGLSGIVPQLFTAAGNLSSARRGVILSRVVGLGYLGMLAGPAVIGWLSDAVGINTALLAPLLCCLAGLLLAGAVRPRTAVPDEAPKVTSTA